MKILTIDVGTSRTKAILWGDGGVIASGTAELRTEHPAPGFAEQDPRTWWASVVAAYRSLGDEARADVVGLTGARQTFALWGPDGDARSTGILWSDRRAPDVAGRLAWLAETRPDAVAGARWMLCPRDRVAWELTGHVATDWTQLSASGFRHDHLTPAPVASATVVGGLTHAASSATGIPEGTPVVIGAGDRACEVLATGASPDAPMVSWGTTANVSVGVPSVPGSTPPGLRVTQGALGGWLLEGGLSAAGSMLEWLARISGRDAAELTREAADRPPGCSGAIALPWLGGARAPWWRDDVGAAFTGLRPHHDAVDLARAVLEGVAWDVVRCLDAMAAAPSCVALVGGGTRIAAWVDVITGVLGVPAVIRRSGEGASVGAAVIAAAALGVPLDVDAIDPVVARREPDPAARARYRDLRPQVDAVAAAVMTTAEP